MHERHTVERMSHSPVCDFLRTTVEKQDTLASVSADETVVQGGLMQVK